MCCCFVRPNVNGQPGYSWDGKESSIHPINPPDIGERETLLFDEPGRCGGIDSHSFHYRMVLTASGSLNLLVRHGGGDERITYLAGTKTLRETLAAMDSTARYWTLNTIWHAYSNGRREGHERTEEKWRKAAAEKRIRVRRGRVEILPKVL